MAHCWPSNVTMSAAEWMMKTEWDHGTPFGNASLCVCTGELFQNFFYDCLVLSCYCSFNHEADIPNAFGVFVLS